MTKRLLVAVTAPFGAAAGVSAPTAGAETLTVAPTVPGQAERVTSQTSFVSGKKYAVVVSGTIKWTDPGQGQPTVYEFDAFYCLSGCADTPPPRRAAHPLAVMQDGYPRTTTVFDSRYSSLSSAPPPYDPSHAYSLVYDEAHGPLTFSALPHGDPYTGGNTYSGAFQVSITPPQEAATVRVKNISGEVVKRRDGGPWTELMPTDVLRAGDEVGTGVDSSVELDFADGDTMTLQELTQIRIGRLLNAAERKDVEIALVVGRVQASVKPRQTVDTNFDIKTPTSTASVRGTRFSVFYDAVAKATLTSVTEGSVAVDPVKPGLPTQTVSAGKEVEVTRKSVSPVANVGKAGARGGLNRAAAVERAHNRVAAAADKCGISTPRKKPFSAKGVRGGWSVTVKVIGRLRGASKWKVTRAKTKPANAIAKKIAAGCG